MKALKIIIPILVIAAIGIGGYFAYSNGIFDQKTPENSISNDMQTSETSDQKIQTDGQFNAIFGGFLQEYTEARVNFSVIFNVDIKELGADEWKQLIDNNIEKWEKVEFYSELLSVYLEDLSPEEAGFLIKTAFAQNDIESIIDSTYPGDAGFDDGARLMMQTEESTGDYAEVGTDIDFEAAFNNEVLRVAKNAEHGRILKDIVEKMGARDVKEALSWLNKANSVYVENQNNAEKFFEEAEDLSRKVRNSAVFAGLAGIAAGGLVATGTSLLYASGTTGVAELMAAAGLSLGTCQLLLDSGNHAAYLLGSEKGKEFFEKEEKEFKEFFGPFEKIHKIYNVITMKLPDPKDFDITEIPDILDNMSTIKEAVMPKSLDDYREVIKKIVEKKYGQEVVVKDENIENPDIPVGPTVESFRSGSYSTTYTMVDPITGVEGSGNINFTIDEEGTAVGTVDYVYSGTITQNTVPIKFNTTFNGTVSGNMEPLYQRLDMQGTYSGTANADANGYKTSEPATGNIYIEATFSNGEFVGTMTATNSLGHSGVTNWEASAQ